MVCIPIVYSSPAILKVLLDILCRDTRVDGAGLEISADEFLVGVMTSGVTLLLLNRALSSVGIGYGTSSDSVGQVEVCLIDRAGEVSQHST